MSDHSRYRLEGGHPAVDLRLSSIDRLFDNRDPAPFRERDLDPDLVEYLIAASEDLIGHTFRIVFWLDKPCEPAEIEEAFRAHFDYELERIDRRRRRQRRIGLVALLLAVVLIAVLLSISQVIGRVVHNSVGAALEEGLLISCWVLMWKPVEILVYDWIPVRRERRVLRRLLVTPIEVRTGKGPEVGPVRHGSTVAA